MAARSWLHTAHTARVVIILHMHWIRLIGCTTRTCTLMPSGIDLQEDIDALEARGENAEAVVETVMEGIRKREEDNKARAMAGEDKREAKRVKKAAEKRKKQAAEKRAARGNDPLDDLSSADEFGVEAARGGLQRRDDESSDSESDVEAVGEAEDDAVL